MKNLQFLSALGLILLITACAQTPSNPPPITDTSPKPTTAPPTTQIIVPAPTSTTPPPATPSITTPTSTTPVTLPTTTPTPTPPAKEQVVITIKDSSFSLTSKEVPVGSTITWKNSDSDAHTITSPQFKSVKVEAGKSVSQTFDKSGTYTYSFSNKPAMKLTVIVK